MATRRIKEITNTATTFASDDFIALDGTTQGTRKMDKDDLIAEVSAGVSGDYLEEANNLSDVASLDTSKLNMEIPDVGTGPNEVPLNGQLGSMAYQSADSVAMGTVEAESLEVTDQASIGATSGAIAAADDDAALVLQQSVGGVAELSRATDTDGHVVGKVNFANRNNSNTVNPGSANYPAVAGIEAQLETTDSNAHDDSGGHLVIKTKPEAGLLAERVRIDSSGRVGIGTSSPGSYAYSGADDLVVGDATGSRGITISTGSSDTGALYFGDAASTGLESYRGMVRYSHSSNSLELGSLSQVRWSIDSSGSLVASSNGTGSRAASHPIVFYGTNSGSVQVDQGSIGTEAGTANSNAGELVFKASNSSGALTERFRINEDGNIQMASGLGIDFGSGATLSDYEEGTFTPTIYYQNSSGLTISYTTQIGRYVRVGDLVSVQVYLVWTVTGTPVHDNIGVSMPLAPVATRQYLQCTDSQGQSALAEVASSPQAAIAASSSFVSNLADDIGAGTHTMIVSGTYQTS